ncbi:Beta-lactamase [Saccharopolyspora antimicrobica]|uniref:Beta-lactamase n=1 Tax=Saccharopolyspora antimicrobica TaxID=455193 RepID=A0A1I4YTD0_9PSEU|nr:Beta-lactamase [Saccharopolyspora antimicrobica]
MFSPQISCGSRLPRTACGYGWFLGPLAGREARYHSGDNAGFKCLNAWLPDIDLRFAALSNQEHVGMGDLEELLGAVATGDF